MKRSYGVMAILLPLPNPKKPLSLQHPLQEGDRLQTGMFHQLKQSAPSSLPLSTLRAKKLILNLFYLHSGTHIAVFPSLDSVLQLHSCRVHSMLLTAFAPNRLDVFLGSDQCAVDLHLPVLAEEKPFKTLLAFADTPHLLSIDPEGQVAHITEGFYISKDNIRKASGLKRHRRISLV